MAYITKTKIGSNTYPIGSCLYGTCSTAAGTAAKVVTMADFDTLIHGVTIHVYFDYRNTAANATLNVNSTGAKSIIRAGGAPGTSADESWFSGQVVSFTYDSTYNSNAGAWRMNDCLHNNTNPYPFVYIDTIASTAEKVGRCSGFTGKTNTYFIALLVYSNTAGTPTLNVNNTGGKPLYLDGIRPTSTTSPTQTKLVAGTYLVYYDGTNYYFRTDGEITCPDDIEQTEIDDLFVWIE